jgi:hypothetical protein
MNNLSFSKYEYYLCSSVSYFKNNVKKRLQFLKEKSFLFLEISSFINNCIDNTKNIYIFSAANSLIGKNIISKKIFIKEIDKAYEINYNKNIQYVDKINESEIKICDTVLITDIEHQLNPTSNLLKLSKIINDNTKIIVLSKNMFWIIFIKIIKFFFSFSPLKNNFLPSSYLENLYSSCNLEIIRKEKIIALPIKIPIITNVINKLFRLPILNIFCLSNVTILKKSIQNIQGKDENKISFIIPCKNEEKNIMAFKSEILNSDKSNEYLFGDDKSTDNTNFEIQKLSKELSNFNIVKYDGPGICKSENVYKGIEISKGDIVVIYDADLTISFKDVEFSIDILKNSNADFINCTRMIYPQKNGAMKFLNFLGNAFFASLFSLLFKRKITDTLCGTKIFYKKDWSKIKKNISTWGIKDLWGDFDLLISSYKNNLKISEVPVTYHERKAENTKMTSVLMNALRMLIIVLLAYYKLRLKK